VIKYSSGIVGEGVFVRDCRGIGRMGVMCKFGLVDYSECGECGIGRDSGLNGRERQEEKVEKR
jgi:hypothetical protein